MNGELNGLNECTVSQLEMICCGSKLLPVFRPRRSKNR